MQRTFQRARAPEEKEVRRQAILEAARALTSELGSVGFSLSELARRSGVSKPNIYRYFESREEVLLQVWIEEVRAMNGVLAKSFGKAKRGDTKATARIMAQSFVARPRLGELMAIVSSVLERNLSVDAIVKAKLALVALTTELADVLHAQLPALSLADCAWVAGAIGVSVAGLWPAAHPAPAVAQALERPELAGMCLSFERDLRRYIEVLLAGLLATAK